MYLFDLSRKGTQTFFPAMRSTHTECRLLYMYFCVCISRCVQSCPPLTVTCICSFGYPGNRRESENFSISCASPTRGQRVRLCDFATLYSTSALKRLKLVPEADRKWPLIVRLRTHVYTQTSPISAVADYCFFHSKPVQDCC